MIPTKFPQSNRHYLKPSNMTEEQCSPLDVFDTGEQLISCWKVSWNERIKILFGKPIWMWVWSRHHPPIALDVHYPFKDGE